MGICTGIACIKDEVNINASKENIFSWLDSMRGNEERAYWYYYYYNIIKKEVQKRKEGSP